MSGTISTGAGTVRSKPSSQPTDRPNRRAAIAMEEGRDRPSEESEPGSQRVRIEGGFHTWGLAALEFPAYQGQSLGEPSDRVEPDWGHDGCGEDTA